jgi:aryl-alcohol dehydrogenase-like predicted oxidoreductase
MQERQLGRSGPKVSLVGLGCNNFGGRIDLDATRAVVHAALDAGITLFDTADVYGENGGSEIALGKILGPRRKDIVLATKFGLPMDGASRLSGASRRYVMSAVEASLKRLSTDWIDLYQLHRPDPSTPIEETLGALDDLVRAGKVRHIGCSNLSARQVVEALSTSRAKGLASFASAQDEYSLLVRDAEAELIPALEANGLGLLPYYPLASGLLTGKYSGGNRPAGARLTVHGSMASRHMSAEKLRTTEKLEAFCTARGRSLLELAMSWLASRPVVSSVIAGATKPEQIAANVAAVSWTLTAEEMAEVGGITGS